MRATTLLALVLLCIALSKSAFAQPAASRAQAVPPKLREEVIPAYPDGATGDASVVLDVVVQPDGSVGSVGVVEGAEPFASRAVEAARTARFEPARRDGRPIAAKIRLLVSFHPPARDAGTRPIAGPARPAPPAPATQPTAVEEVVVTGRREDPRTSTEHRLTRNEMRIVPGAFGDPFRAIDVLPSLVPIISGLPFYYVRGAPPSAVGYYIDEVRVPYLFHFGLGPGVIQPALIEEVALHPAAFPARYGRFSGGIVSGTTRDPPTELYGEGQIRIYDAGAYVEAPLANGRATVGVGGRYSYTAGLYSLFAPDTTIDYGDYNARVSWAIDDRWRLSALALGSFDYASEIEEGVERVYFASEFHRLDLRADRRGADGATSRIATTIGLDRTRLEDARFAQNFLSGVRGRHRWPASRAVEIELGADILAEHYSGDLPSRFAVSRSEYEQVAALFSPRIETAMGAWTSATYKPLPGWDLTGTLRSDVFTSDGAVAVGPSPRVSMRVPLTTKLSFLGALGIAPQPPAFAIPIPAVGYPRLPGGLSFAYQKSAGAELRLPWRFTFKAVGFHHSYFNLRDFAPDRDDVELKEPPLAQIEPTSPTQAYGLELLLMRKLSERFSAFASGTVSRAQLGSTRKRGARASPFDRTWVAQVGGVVDLGRNWRVSSRFLTYGGWPGEKPEDDRLRAFYRMDLRIEKRWVWGERRYIAVVIEGLNVTATKEILARSCDNGRCRNEEFGPLVAPNIGVEGAL